MTRALTTVVLALAFTGCGTSPENPPVEPSAPPPEPGPPAMPTPPATAAAPVASAEPTVTATAVADAHPTTVASAEPAPVASASVAVAAAPPGVSGANVRIDSMTADGLTIEELSCRADGLGILGSILIVGSLSKHKKALDACAPGGDRARVEWTAGSGKVGNVKVKAKTPAVEKCVTKVLASAQAPFEGSCAATLVIGK